VGLSFDGIVVDYVSLVTELSKTPLAAPLVFAAIWRARTRDRTIQTVIAAAVLPYLLVRLWPLYLPVGHAVPPPFLDVGQWEKNILQSLEPLQLSFPEWTPPRPSSPELLTLSYISYLILLIWPTTKLTDFIKIFLIGVILFILSIGFRFILLYEGSIFYSPHEMQQYLFDPTITRSARIASLDSYASFVVSIPLSAAAYAMTMFILIWHICTYVHHSYESTNIAGMIINIVCSVLIMFGVIAGFAILPAGKGILLLLFFIFAYPFVLAVTRNRMADENLIRAYISGWIMLGALVKHR